MLKMAKESFILTVDVGACSLKTAEFIQRNKKLELINFACVEYESEVSEDNRHEEINKAFASILQTHKFKAKKLYLSISGQEVFTRFAKLPASSSAKDQKFQQLVNYEARQNIPFPIEEVTWDFQIVSNGTNDQKDINVMYAVVKNDIILSIVSVFERAGFQTVLVGTSLTSTYNCMCALGLDQTESSALINIGGKCTNIIFIDKGKFFARAIPLGGYSITQQISKDLNISFKEAEELKRTIGYVSMGSNHETGDEQGVAVATSIRNVMIRIHGEINRSINIYKSQSPDNKFFKIYLAGGSSIINYTDSFLSGKLKIPVEYLNPFSLISLNQSVNKKELSAVGHMFLELIGLAINSITSCPIEISLLPNIIKNKHFLQKKTPYFYAIAAAVVLNLGIIYWGVLTQKQISDDLIITNTEQTKRIQASVTSVKKLIEELNTQKTFYNTVLKGLNGRNAWFEILDSLQKALPDNTWLTLLEASGKPNIAAEKPVPQESGIKSIFGRTKSRYPQAITTVEAKTNSIEWIRVKAHTLVLFKSLKTTEPEKFKENLLKLPCFTDKAEEIVIIDYKPPIKDSDNISSFDMIIKLRNPIPGR